MRLRSVAFLILAVPAAPDGLELPEIKLFIEAPYNYIIQILFHRPPFIAVKILAFILVGLLAQLLAVQSEHCG
jgi:hypothetical protein